MSFKADRHGRRRQPQPARRSRERRLVGHDCQSADALRHQLRPARPEQYPVSVRRRDVVVAGQSLGGLAALWTLVRHPDAIGCAPSQSASLWQDEILTAIPAVDLTGTRAWLEVGTQEWVLQPRHAPAVRLLCRAGADVEYRQYNGGQG